MTTSDLYVLVQADQDPESEGPPTVNINLDCRVATPAPTQLPTSPPTPVPTFEFVRVVEVRRFCRRRRNKIVSISSRVLSGFRAGILQ